MLLLEVCFFFFSTFIDPTFLTSFFLPPTTFQDPEKHKICLYEVGEFKGRKMEIMDDDVPSLFSYGFTDRVGSIMVSCGT